VSISVQHSLKNVTSNILVQCISSEPTTSNTHQHVTQVSTFSPSIYQLTLMTMSNFGSGV